MIKVRNEKAFKIGIQFLDCLCYKYKRKYRFQLLKVVVLLVFLCVSLIFIIVIVVYSSKCCNFFGEHKFFCADSQGRTCEGPPMGMTLVGLSSRH